MRFGVQMYGVNPIFLRDKGYFLRRIAGAGYRFLEPCLTLSDIPELRDRVWMPEDFAENLPLLRQYGVKIYSCYVFTRDLPGELEELIRLAGRYDIRQLVLPCPRFRDEAEGKTLARTLTTSADRLKAAGIELLLHNDREDVGYEWLLNQCGESVGAQTDVGWLLFCGTDPEAFLWRNRARVRSLHYKDMAQGETGLTETGIGRGLVDMTACFQFARAAEIIQLADQDSSGDFLADLDSVAGKFRELTQIRDRTTSKLCVLDTQTGEVRTLRTFDRVVEAPNWMQTDEDVLVYNSGGHIYKYRISTGEETQIPAGNCGNCNNDHVLSPDNTQIAVSHSKTGWMSQIYTLPLAGGEPRLVTPNAPSFLHGWSPDGKELAYCAFRDHGRGMEVDIYTIPAGGGEERRLTRDAGFNDGPEYSPDGRHIWFISTRSGLMQCWRMNRDGSEQTQMTFRQRNNWFPHVSPDGKKVVYLSYSREGLDPEEHLPNMQVELGLMNADGTDDRRLLTFFGGQGSINVNSWHRDSRLLAFVMYELEHK